MPGSTILAFHTSFHCKNFIETKDRHMEARIEHEHSPMSFNGSDTFVGSYPICIAWRVRERIAPRFQRHEEPGP